MTEKLAYTIKEAVLAGGPGRSSLYKAIREGRLSVVKFGRSTRILADELRRFLNAAPTSTSGGKCGGHD